jgi:bifunctional DNA-binding transcriptional regulator/antitoxin component of YhaV-PrlF toxin-antitoxin module
MITNMTQKRQVTVPKAICDEEGFAPGQPVRVERLAGGGVGLFVAPASVEREEKRKRIRAAINFWSGKGLDQRPTDVIMRELRGEDLP